MPSATAPVRIPAWQRLGLKLKYAQASKPTSDPPVVIESLKRKNADLIEQSSPKKVAKHSKDQLLAPSTNPPVTPNLARKKSVTFTPETKVEDGDSVKQLFNAWVTEQKSQDPAFQPKSSKIFDTPEPPKVDEDIDITLGEKERRVGRVKQSVEKVDGIPTTTKQKKTKPSKSSKVIKATNTPPRPFLAYLKQYHESRDTWRFNKNHQNHLLKHVFNVEVIPSDYIHLIYDYIQGLQGGVRTRLRDAAFAIKVKDQEDGEAGFPDSMTDRNKRQREYDTAMEEYVAAMTAADASRKLGYEEGVLLGLSDIAMAGRVAKRMRAEQILTELSTSGEGKEEENATRTPGPKMSYDDDDSQKRLRLNNGSTQKLVRRRKQRTTVEDDDTSSSEESSDSETSSDEESETVTHSTQVETSSSSSSSSSSGSEDDDDDEEDEEDDSEESDSE